MMDFIWTLIQPHIWKKDEPDAFAPIKYDPQFGFEDKPRPQKRVPASVEEMDSAFLETSARDFCASYHIAYRNCWSSNKPFVWRCYGLKQELAHCYYEERLHDMKEFEREKRLNQRESRLTGT